MAGYVLFCGCFIFIILCSGIVCMDDKNKQDNDEDDGSFEIITEEEISSSTQKISEKEKSLSTPKVTEKKTSPSTPKVTEREKISSIQLTDEEINSSVHVITDEEISSAMSIDLALSKPDATDIASEFEMIGLEEVAPDRSKCSSRDFRMSRIVLRDRGVRNINVCLSSHYAGIIVKLKTPILIPYTKIINVIWIKHWLQLEFGQQERNLYLESKPEDLKEFEDSLLREMRAFSCEK